MSMVRSSALSGYSQLVGELGGDPASLLERFRIAPASLDEPQAFIPYASLIRLLEHSARELGCPDFGLRLSTRQDLGILGPLGVAVRNCQSLGEAMECASRYMFVHSPAIAFSARGAPEEGRVWLVFEILIDPRGSAAQVTELSVGLAARILTMLSREPQPIREVRFAHARCSPMTVYWSHFGAPVAFETGTSALVLERSDLALPIEDASLQLRELAEDYLELHHAADSRDSSSARVRRVVARSLGTGSSSFEDIAAAFAVHPRTLQRQLRDEGTTFEKIKDEARAELAWSYLANPDLPMSQVAALLDYSEQSTLTRSCKRWFGRTPRQLRASHRGSGP